MSTYDKETEAIKAFWDDSTIIDEQAARIAELEMHLAAAAETIAQHARADAAAWGASFEQQNEHAANATAQIRALLNGGMPVRDDTRRRDSRIAELEAEIATLGAEYVKLEGALRRIAQLENDSDTSDLVVLNKALRIAVGALGNQPSTRIAELEAQLAAARAERNVLAEQLNAARLLLVAIDENLDMDVNPLTITTGRIVELLRDPASNPWASLMRAGKEGGA